MHALIDLDVVMLGRSEVGVPFVCDAGEPVQLEQGEYALIPCREGGPEGQEPRRGQVVANGAACVRALGWAWMVPKQLVLVGNIGQPSVQIANGDIVGALLFDSAVRGDGRDLPEVAHVWQRWDALHDIAELDVPSPEY